MQVFFYNVKNITENYYKFNIFKHLLDILFFFIFIHTFKNAKKVLKKHKKVLKIQICKLILNGCLEKNIFLFILLFHYNCLKGNSFNYKIFFKHLRSFKMVKYTDADDLTRPPLRGIITEIADETGTSRPNVYQRIFYSKNPRMIEIYQEKKREREKKFEKQKEMENGKNKK